MLSLHNSKGTDINNNKTVMFSMNRVVLLHSILIKLTTGNITIDTSDGECFSVTGPSFIFLAKDQVINISFNSTESSINYGIIEIESNIIKNIYNCFLFNEKILNTTGVKNTSVKHLTSPINLGVSKVFNLLQASDSENIFPAEKREYLIRFILSEFIHDHNAIPLFKSLAINSLREDIYISVINDSCRKWSLSDMADKFHMSQATLKRKLHLENVSFSEIVLNARMNKAAKLLRNNNFSITKVSYMCGYDSASYFTTVFKKHFKVTPSEFLNFVNNNVINDVAE
ncbi:helix-turn-helix domain-containing protein [Citrobacter braakii]|uniref:helix-turn-helix domain-containing protein n=1 Tax=Citrobacter braakii TaxID=57706 RepID=UPI001BD0CD66|nr:helix-turn-helix domain-containing protein [Citrobacter braakii]